MKTRVTIFLLFVALLAGCRGSRHLAESTSPEAADSTAVESVRQRTCFAANFQCDLYHVRLNGMLRMMEDSVLWVSVNKVVELGRAYLTPDSVNLYARVTQQYFRGDYNDAYRVSGYRVDYEQLQNLFLEAFRERRRDVDLVLPSPQRNDTLHLVFTHYTAVREQTYPFSIPNSARPL